MLFWVGCIYAPEWATNALQSAENIKPFAHIVASGANWLEQRQQYFQPLALDWLVVFCIAISAYCVVFCFFLL